MPHHNRKTVKK